MSALPSTAINEADVIIGERIGVGCSVAVFRATWNGLTLAAKVYLCASLNFLPTASTFPELVPYR